MGVDIHSKNESVTMGYGSFGLMRTKIAEMISDKWKGHYEKLLNNTSRDKEWFDWYDAKTQEMADVLPTSMWPVLDFLYMSDCEGELDKDRCKALASFLDEHENQWGERSYTYVTHPSFTIGDLRDMLQDGIDTGDGVWWW